MVFTKKKFSYLHSFKKFLSFAEKFMSITKVRIIVQHLLVSVVCILTAESLKIATTDWSGKSIEKTVSLPYKCCFYIPN